MGIAGILHVSPVNLVGGQPFLVMGRHHRRQVDRPGAFGAVKAPDRFGDEGIHIHGFGTVAPGRGNRDGNPLQFAG